MYVLLPLYTSPYQFCFVKDYLQASIFAVFQVALVTFTAYSLVNLNNPAERLTADKAFVALSLFNILRFPLAMLPMLISNLAKAHASMERLRSFLKREELDPDVVEWTSQFPVLGNIYVFSIATPHC